MRGLVRWSVRIGGLLLCLAAFAAAYLLLIQGRPPAKRPDLVRLPDNVAPMPPGYPTFNAIVLSYLLGRLELLALEPVEVPDDVTAHTGLVYRSVDGSDLKLDLHLPKDAAAPLPLLVFIHGGGWSKGHRDDYHYYTVRFAQRGYAAATLSYRLSPKATFPDAVEDIKCALSWLQRHAGDYGIDPGRTIVIGGSAGGYLSLMAGLTEREEYCGDCPAPLARPMGIVNLYGPTDLTAPVAQHAPEVTGFLGVSWDEAPERFREASPLTHLSADDPPVLTIHGTLDQIVPIEQGDVLVEKLQELGVHHWYDRIDGFPHTMDLTPAINERVQWLVHAFVETLSPVEIEASIPDGGGQGLSISIR